MSNNLWKDLALKERTKVLQVLVEKYFEDHIAFAEFKLVEILHGHRWLHHPDGNRQVAHARLILESLNESGELQKDKWYYKLTVAVEPRDSQVRERKYFFPCREA